MSQSESAKVRQNSSTTPRFAPGVAPAV